MALTLQSIAQAQTFTPVPLTPGSFNESIVIPANWPYKLNNQSVSVTIDNGPTLQTDTVTGYPTYYSIDSGDTYFEQGMNRAHSNYGLPAGGSLLTNATFSSHVYQLGYWTNWNSNCVCICPYTNGLTYNSLSLVGGPYTYPANPYYQANMTLNNTNGLGGFNTNIYTALSILVSGGAGSGSAGATNTIKIQYADGTSQTVTDVIPNWFVNAATINYGPYPTASFAYTAQCRCNPSENNNNFTVSSGTTSGSRLWSIDFALNNTSAAATNLIINPQWTYAYSHSADVIFSVSGSANPADDATVPSTAVLTGPFTPIPASGFNAGCVVANSPQTLAGLAPLTATMDYGTNLNGGNNTWFEVGWDGAAPTNGFPAHGSTLTSLAFSSRSYQMAASYNQPMSTLVDTNHQVVNITPQVPGTNWTALSLLTCGASIGSGNRMTNLIILQHLDGVQETNIFIGYDWFETSQSPAYDAWERCNIGSSTSTSGREVENLDTTGTSLGVPHMFDTEFQFYDPSPVTNFQCRYYLAGGTSWTTYIIAVSASTNALPVSAVASYTAAQNVFAGQTATFSISHGTGSGLYYQWQYTDGETFTNNFSDGPSPVYDSSATISGSQTPTLTIANVGPYDTGISNASGTNIYYMCLLTNAIPSQTNSPMAVLTLRVSTATNVLMPGDVLSDFYGSPPTFGEAYPTPAGLLLTNVEDGTLAAYLNYGASGGNTAYTGPVGFTVSPQAGATVVNALRFYVAVNAPVCDPADFALDGSNDGGNTWTPIVPDTLLSLPVERNLATSLAINVTNQIMQEVTFANAAAYTTYRVTIQNVRGGTPTPNSMQIAEIQFLGAQAALSPDLLAQVVPTNKTLLAGGTYSATLEAGGITPFYYQWYSVNGGVTNGVANATNVTITLTNVQPAASGNYFCVVSNVYGAVTSSLVSLTVLTPGPNYVTTVVGDHPLMYWRLDEGNGASSTEATPNGAVAANDYMGNHNGVYTNADIGVSPGYSTNDTDTAAGFGDAYFTTSDSAVWQVPMFTNFVAKTNQPAAFSVEAWVQSPLSSDQTLAGAGIVTFGYGGGGEQFALDCGSSAGSNAFRFYFRDATLGTNVFSNPSHTANAPATATTTDGKWHHVVGVLNSQNPSNNANYIYVDGFLANSNGLGTNLLGVQYGATPLTIGSRSSASTTNLNLQFNGNIDEVALYPYALSSTQVLNHYYASGIMPFFTLQPTNETVSQGATASMLAGVRGTPTVSYQWYQVLPNGTTNTLVNGPSAYGTISGATSTNLVIVDVQTDPNGQDQYVLVAKNAFGPTYSAQVYLDVVNGPPTVIQDLQTEYEFTEGFQFQLFVVADGAQPFTYGWYYNGSPLANGSRISGVNSNVLTVLNAQMSDSGTYQLFITNAYSTPSTPSTAAAVTIVPTLGFNGFGGGWVTNAFNSAFASFTSGFISSNVLELTDGSPDESSSSFFQYPVYVGAFKASFTYQDVNSGNGDDTGADGACFVIQNSAAGSSALGGGGGSLGVSGLTNSAELELNIYSGNSFGGVGFAFSTNGVVANVTDPYPLDIGNGNPVLINVTYLNGIVSLSMAESNGAGGTNHYTDSIAVNLPAAVGGTSAYVGFTGSDGGTASTQTISDFNFVSLPNLTVQSASGSTVVLSWPAGVGDYVLQSSSSLRSPSWSNVSGTVTQSGGMNQQTVSSTGAATYYRLHVQYTPQ
jgi:hypothetical protein